MKSTLFVLAAILSVALCQTSSNPEGESWFSYTNVRQLDLNQNESSIIYNTTGYQDFWYVWIPSYVGSVTYYFNNTDFDYDYDHCYTSLYAYISLVEDLGDDSRSFPCPDASGTAFCDTYDASLYSYSYEDTQTFDLTNYYLRPGSYHYITVQQSSDGYMCPYTLGVSVDEDLSCDNSTQAVVFEDYGVYQCSFYTNATTNGGMFSSNVATISDYDLYRVWVPQNVSRVWALVQSFSNELEITITQHFASLYYYTADDYDDYATYNSTNLAYVYFVEFEQPTGDSASFIAVYADSSFTTAADYNITIGWSACGSSYAGVGELYIDEYIPEITYGEPDCSESVVQNINITTQTSWNFVVPRYNYTTDQSYSGVYAYLAVPWGSTGYVNFTCNCTDDDSDTFVVFTKNAMADCATYSYDEWFYCTYPGSTLSAEYFYVLSEDLFVGGYWSVAICTGEDLMDISATVSITGAVSGPAAPSPSASPSSNPAASPSASPDADSDSDSNSSFGVVPAVAFVAMAAFSAMLF